MLQASTATRAALQGSTRAAPAIDLASAPPAIDAAITPAVSYSIKGAVRASGLNRTRIYRAIGSKELRAKKDGRQTVILADDLCRYLQNLPDYEPAQAA